MPSTNNATGSASSAPKLFDAGSIYNTPNTKTNVPMTSVSILLTVLLMAGALQKTAS